MPTHPVVRSRRPSVRRLPIVVLALTVPSAAFAQIDITPFGGALLPTGSLMDQHISGNGTSGSVELKQKRGFVSGASVHGWLNPRYGLKGTLGYAWSDLQATGSMTNGTGTFVSSATETGNVMLASTKMLVRVAGQRDTGPMMYVGLGPSFVHRTSDAFDEEDGVKLDNPDAWGGAVELSGQYHIGDNVRVHAGVESFLYSAKVKYLNLVTDQSYDFDSQFQGDFVGSLGLSFRFGGGADGRHPVIATSEKR